MALLMNNGEIAASGEIEAVLKNETLQAVYGIDIHGFMLDSLQKWQTS